MADKDEVEPTQPSEPSPTPPAPDDADDTTPEEVDDVEESPTSREESPDTGLDDGELVAVGAAPATRRSKTADTESTTDRGRKGKATRKRDQGSPKKHRTSPMTFIRESVGELRKVVYPTGQQLVNYFIVVLIFVLFIIAFVSLLDLAFGAVIFRIFA